MTYTIYIATNTINGKRYVGATKHSVEKRRDKHYADARGHFGGCRLFYRAIRKYGESAFTWRIIEQCDNVYDAMDAEILWISQLRPEYNITSGGHGMLGIPRTKEWNERAANSNRGKKRSAAVVAKIKQQSRDHLFKSVVCLNDGQLYKSITAASQKYGISQRQISSICSGIEISAKGLSFVKADKLLDESTRLTVLKSLSDKKIEASSKGGKARRRPVICINDGKWFESCVAAAKESNVTALRITQICNGEGETQSGLRFMYADASSPPKSVRADAERLAKAKKLVLAALARGQKKIKKRVVCLDDDGAIYESISEAARIYRQHVSAVSAAIYRNGRAGGLRFQFVENVK